jgi:hypothetical protein
MPCELHFQNRCGTVAIRRGHEDAGPQRTKLESEHEMDQASVGVAVARTESKEQDEQLKSIDRHRVAKERRKGEMLPATESPAAAFPGGVIAGRTIRPASGTPTTPSNIRTSQPSHRFGPTLLKG